MTKQSEDYFSPVAADYRRYRPSYPGELHEYLARRAPGRRRAWDCGTGSGKVAVALAPYFDEVIATDISQDQLDNAEKHPRVHYRLGRAEHSGLEECSVDLAVSAQAAHWFQIDEFYREVTRVLRPGGVFAIWCYSLLSVREDIDAVVKKFHDEILGDYWPKRTLEDHTYRDIPFPFDEFPDKPFQMKAEWSLERLLSYFRTWSAVHRRQQATSVDPLSLVEDDFSRTWGDRDKVRQITWTIHLRHGTRFQDEA